MADYICIYHGNCDDGFAAAFAIHQAAVRDGKDVEFYSGVYQQDPPDVTDKWVIMVDFSYKRPVIEAMLEQCASLAIYDHHKTAIEDLGDLQHPKLRTVFDMNRSGAMIAWNSFHHGEETPLFFEYIQDRDLWRKVLPGGDEFTIALRSYPQDFKVWEEIVARGVNDLIAEGISIQRYYRLRVEEAKKSSYTAWVRLKDGREIPCRIANAAYFAASEVAGELAEEFKDEVKFGACYFEVSENRFQYSLRSRDDFDVSEVALNFGGGGHKQAAGFTSAWPVHVSAEDM